MNVYENIQFPLKVRKVRKADHHQRVMKATAMVELEEFLHRKPAELSGGQRQHVALARAIVRKPKEFLMDEPLSNLDAKLRVSTRAQIKNLSHELQVTTIYVTHDQIEAMTLADRVVVMNKGVVQQVGTPTDIYDNPADIYDNPANRFVASFIGSPAMNLVDGHLENGCFKAKKMMILGFNSSPDGPLVIGFQAEDANVSSTAAELNFQVFSLELLGDSTMVTARVGEGLVSIKAGKDYRTKIGADFSVNINANLCHLFDAQSGQRI